MWPLVIVVVLAPLPFASVLPWSWGILGICVGLLLAVWAVLTVLGRSGPPVPVGRVWLPVLLFSGVSLWVLVQMMSPLTEPWHHPLWRDVATSLRTDVAGSIAIDRFEAGSALLRLLTYGGVFWLSLQCCRDRDAARKILLTVAAATVVYAIYGLVIQFSGAKTILWYPKLYYVDDLTSTFVNRNSFATYGGLGLICVTALITQQTLRHYWSSDNRRQRLRVFLRALTERDWILILAWGLLATAVLLSNSRGGFAAVCFGLGAFVVAILLSPGVPSRVARAFAFAVVASGLLFVFVSGGDLLTRVASTNQVNDQIRIELTALSVTATGDAPLVGTGFGSFEQIFHVYRGDTEAFRIRSDRAHNTYLENALELGIPAASALVATVGCLAWICLMGIRRRRRGIIYPAVGLGATILVGVHSLVDFSLQIPAVAITYSLLMGLACAQSWNTEKHMPLPRRRQGVNS